MPKPRVRKISPARLRLGAALSFLALPRTDTEGTRRIFESYAAFRRVVMYGAIVAPSPLAMLFILPPAPVRYSAMAIVGILIVGYLARGIYARQLLREKDYRFTILQGIYLAMSGLDLRQLPTREEVEALPGVDSEINADSLIILAQRIIDANDDRPELSKEWQQIVPPAAPPNTMPPGVGSHLGL
ncbi:hypothetical protein BH09SUM1_BH09SUM1_29590 [soil metagenome]